MIHIQANIRGLNSIYTETMKNLNAEYFCSKWHRRARSVLGTLLLGFAVPCSAAPQWCAGQATRVLVYGMGDLVIFSTWRNDWTALCNLNTDRMGVSPSVCKSWQASLLSAQAQRRNVIVQYGEAPSCATLPNYHSSPAPAYVMIDES